MSSKKSLQELRQKRKSQRASLSRLYNYFNDQQQVEDKNYFEIEARFQSFEDKFKEFDETQGKIELLTKDEEFEREQQIRIESENEWFKTKAIILKLLSEKTKVQTTRTDIISDSNLNSTIQSLIDKQSSMNSVLEKISTNHKSEPLTEIKLPAIDIPKFSGKFEEWVTFHDLFNNIVHQNKHLSNAQKLQFLKSSLVGDAISSLKHLTISDANYFEAWNELKIRFNKPKIIINAHLKNIIEYPIIQYNIKSLNDFINTVTESVSALKALDLPIEHWDCWLVYIISNKLDHESKQLWIRQSAEDDHPKYNDLIKFLTKRQCELQTLQINKKPEKQKQANVKQIFNVSMQTCQKCKANHPIHKCKEFKLLSVNERKTFASLKKLCFNCLATNHSYQNCQSSNCRICNKRHHTLLHVFENTALQTPCTSTEVQSMHTITRLGTTVLPTAVVLVKDANGSFQHCRLLLDSRADVSLITESCAQRLCLTRKRSKCSITGVGGENSHNTNGVVNLEIKSRLSNRTIRTNAFILSKISKSLFPKFKVNQDCTWLQNVQLADEKFLQPGPIDILIGAEFFFNILLEGQVEHSSGIIARNTIFGYIICGKIDDDNKHSSQIFHMTCDVDELLQRFWTVEEPNQKAPIWTEEEKQCEEHFTKTHYRLPSGRYVVSLPFKTNEINFGNSKEAALSSFKLMEKRSIHNQEFHQQYSEFMKEYEDLEHMKKIENIISYNVNDNDSYFIPHHAVLKESSQTTKLRVVFNASKKSSSGLSLNDQLLVGPVVQNDLITILLRFRTNKIAFIADVTKMYRQILLNHHDTKYQKIFWRSSQIEPIRVYELLTVTYETASAPFLATRTLNQLANDERKNYPLAADIIQNSFYVDDLMSGAESETEALEIISEITGALKAGGFVLRKWFSNSDAIIQEFPEEFRAVKSFKSIYESDQTIKTLGLNWDAENDKFIFQAFQQTGNKHPTKRSILSTIAKIYDPIGWLAPIVVRLKILIQQLWILGVSWDDKLPEDICNQWKSFEYELQTMHQIQIPRWIPFKCREVQMHVFTDASEKAYAAVVYLRIRENDRIITRLVFSKTRVAPIKQIRLPRLELCAAHLGTELVIKIRTIFNLQNNEIFCWTDSKIVLAWLSDHPRRWTTFVANRTAEILEVAPKVNWHHIPSKLNPADIASRGVMPSELVSMKLWWDGPQFLQDMSFDDYLTTSTQKTHEEEKGNCLITIQCTDDLASRFSSFLKLIRISAMCFRFYFNTRTTKSERRTSNITVQEFRHAQNIWFKHIQLEFFHDEIKASIAKKPISSKSILISYSPFIDNQGLLRAGGRLSEAEICYAQKHPIILAGKHPLTLMMLRELHQIHLHANQRVLLSMISTRFIIIGIKRLIKQVVQKCVTCIRHKAQLPTQQMGQLPKVRVTPSRPFFHTGVDYAGPISVRSWKGRGTKTYKAYIALFICMSTKAFHLELVSGLSTEDFIAALKRFVARRGYCATIYSDNGTAFVGANRHFIELGNLLKSKQHQDQITTFTTNRCISWHFIPPSAPHFGGIWKSGVKLVKHHLKRQLNVTSCTFEELTTLLCQIEAVINSRPLLINEVNDGIEPLTPAHFLVGSSLLTVPEDSQEEKPLNLLKRWEYIQGIHQIFWRQWKNDYLTQLQRKTKWKTKSNNLQVDDIVIIKDDNSTPGAWNLGRIVSIHPGKDELVRVVSIKTKAGICKRPVTKLVKLLQEENC